MRWLVALLALFAACAGKPPVPGSDAGTETEPDAGQPMFPMFQAEAAPAGPALFVKGQLQDGKLQLEVFGKGLGPIIGYAFRLSLEGLEAKPDTVIPVDEALGTENGSEVVYLRKRSDTSLLFAGARLGAAAGEKTVDAETRLAHIELLAPSESGRVTLIDTSIRRLNGEGVSATVSGGKIVGAP